MDFTKAAAKRPQNQGCGSGCSLSGSGSFLILTNNGHLLLISFDWKSICVYILILYNYGQYMLPWILSRPDPDPNKFWNSDPDTTWFLKPGFGSATLHRTINKGCPRLFLQLIVILIYWIYTTLFATNEVSSVCRIL